jgi:hypothetical protein
MYNIKREGFQCKNPQKNVWKIEVYLFRERFALLKCGIVDEELPNGFSAT